jgi:hypothetical protein
MAGMAGPSGNGDHAQPAEEAQEQALLEQRLWPAVSSPVARRVLCTVYAALSYGSRQALEHPYFEPAIGTVEWRLLRAGLERAGLAQAIAAGNYALPNIYESVPRLWRGVAQNYRPRKPEDVALHVLTHLGWYLLPGSVPRLQSLGALRRVGLWLLLAAAPLAAMLLLLWISRWLFVIAACVLPWFILRLLAWVSRITAPLFEQGQTSDTEALCFFIYLRDAYSDHLP